MFPSHKHGMSITPLRTHRKSTPFGQRKLVVRNTIHIATGLQHIVFCDLKVLSWHFDHQKNNKHVIQVSELFKEPFPRLVEITNSNYFYDILRQLYQTTWIKQWFDLKCVGLLKWIILFENLFLKHNYIFICMLWATHHNYNPRLKLLRISPLLHINIR